MPITKSAKKAQRSSLRKKISNEKKGREMKESIKNLKKMIRDKKAGDSEKMLPLIYQTIDKATKKGLIKKNTASRKKSRLTKLVKKIS